MLPTPRQRTLNRFEALKMDRATWLDIWRDVSDHVSPTTSRFLVTNANRGERKFGKIINGRPMWALRTLAAGMAAGITPNSRPWFRLTTPEPGLDEMDAVKLWLRQVEDRMRLVFARSNVYNILHGTYTHLGAYGTACAVWEDDEQDIIRGYLFPVGSYALAQSARLAVDSVYRESKMTVKQMVDRFGMKRVSESVRELYTRGDLDTWRNVLHCIHPRSDYEPGLLGPQGMRFASSWWDTDASDVEGPLGEGGYNEFPATCPRWETTGEDVYGQSPAMHALGDCKALQLYERRSAQASDKVVNPPMKASASLQSRRVGLLPGDVTYVPGLGAQGDLAPAVEVNPQAVPLFDAKIQRLEQRIETAFYADLWLMLSQSDGTMTAREVIERREEKLLQLGTVLERLQDELLDPLIERTFSILTRAGLIPEAPKELQGSNLRVEYISIMAQAQKLLGTTQVERLIGFVQSAAQMKPDVIDTVDWDQTIQEYAGMLGTPPVLVRSDDAIESMRKAREAEVQQQQQMQQAAAAADTAQKLGNTPVGTPEGDAPNALQAMLKGMGAA